jgi:hypothetical protein
MLTLIVLTLAALLAWDWFDGKDWEVAYMDDGDQDWTALPLYRLWIVAQLKALSLAGHDHVVVNER